MLNTLGALTLVALLWGVTNPFIKRGTKGLRSVSADSPLGQAYAEVTFLLFNWRYTVPWLINQCGSLLYVATLQSAALSLAVPTANALSLLATAVTSALIGEQQLTAKSMLGVFLIVSGTMLCYAGKS